jgi:hypothetical protein
MLGRRVVAQRLVRALLVVETLEAAQALELLAQAARRRVGGILQQREMQPLQPAVLLRLARRRVSERMCKQVSVSLPYRGDSHDDQYDDYTGVAGSTSC